MSQSTPTKHDGRAVLFAAAELLVYAWVGLQKENHYYITVAKWQSN